MYTVEMRNCFKLAKDFCFHEPLEIALKATVCGAFIAKTLQQNLINSDYLMKTDHTPVTIADISVQALIFEILKVLSPGDIKVVAEEQFDVLPKTILGRVIDELNKQCPLSSIYHMIGFSHSNDSSLIENPLWTIQHILQQYRSTTLISTEQIELFKLNYFSKKKKNNAQWNDQFYFLLDPIDGTKGYIRGQQFSVGLALIDISSGDIVCSIIACPNYPDILNSTNVKSFHNPGYLFFAVLGEGTHMISFDGLKQSNVQDFLTTLKVQRIAKPYHELTFLESAESNHTNYERSSKCVSLLTNSHIKNHCLSIRLDSMAKFCAVARDYYEKVWDILPGTLILSNAAYMISYSPVSFCIFALFSGEAGGYISHADGSPIKGNNQLVLNNTSGIVATGDGGIIFHNAMLQAVQETAAK